MITAQEMRNRSLFLIQAVPSFDLLVNLILKVMDKVNITAPQSAYAEIFMEENGHVRFETESFTIINDKFNTLEYDTGIKRSFREHITLLRYCLAIAKCNIYIKQAYLDYNTALKNYPTPYLKNIEKHFEEYGFKTLYCETYRNFSGEYLKISW